MLCSSLAVDELHDKEISTVGFVGAEKGGDVRMVQRRECSCPAVESRYWLSVGGHGFDAGVFKAPVKATVTHNGPPAKKDRLVCYYHATVWEDAC